MPRAFIGVVQRASQSVVLLRFVSIRALHVYLLYRLLSPRRIIFQLPVIILQSKSSIFVALPKQQC